MFMQPEATPPSDYDFILNHGSAPKKTLLPGAGSSQKQRIMVAVIGGLLLILVFFILFAVVKGGKGKNSATLLQIAQTQNELIRISTLGATNAGSSNTKALAVTTQLSIETAQQDILAQLGKQGTKTNPKILAATKNPKTDEILSAAATDNRYDEVLAQAIQTNLTQYQKLLKTAFDATGSQSLKLILNNDFATAAKLIESTKNG